jgi:hypothetical protein
MAGVDVDMWLSVAPTGLIAVGCLFLLLVVGRDESRRHPARPRTEAGADLSEGRADAILGAGTDGGGDRTDGAADAADEGTADGSDDASGSLTEVAGRGNGRRPS